MCTIHLCFEVEVYRMDTSMMFIYCSHLENAEPISCGEVCFDLDGCCQGYWLQRDLTVHRGRIRTPIHCLNDLSDKFVISIGGSAQGVNYHRHVFRDVRQVFPSTVNRRRSGEQAQSVLVGAIRQVNKLLRFRKTNVYVVPFVTQERRGVLTYPLTFRSTALHGTRLDW